MAGSIVDLVKQDQRLQNELKELLKAKYLAPGIFHPEAYLVDTDKIDRKWKSRGRVNSRISTLAVGVAIYNQFSADVYAFVAAGDDPMATPETSNWLNEWKEFVEEQYPDEAEEILASASNTGQYSKIHESKIPRLLILHCGVRGARITPRPSFQLINSDFEIDITETNCQALVDAANLSSFSVGVRCYHPASQQQSTPEPHGIDAFLLSPDQANKLNRDRYEIGEAM